MSSHFGLADITNGGINGRIVNLFVRIPNVVNACRRIGFQATPDGVEFQAYGTQKEQSYITMMIDKSSNCQTLVLYQYICYTNIMIYLTLSYVLNIVSAFMKPTFKK